MASRRKTIGFVAPLTTFVLAGVLPAPSAPIDGLHYLVGSWKCSYRAGADRLVYRATYGNDLGGHALRQLSSWAGGGDEELLAYDAAHRGWTATIFDDHGNTTIMRANGRDPNHVAYRSVYPDASIAETFDRISATEYTLHATVRSGGRTSASTDTCVRDTR